MANREQKFKSTHWKKHKQEPKMRFHVAHSQQCFLPERIQHILRASQLSKERRVKNYLGHNSAKLTFEPD